MSTAGKYQNYLKTSNGDQFIGNIDIFAVNLVLVDIDACDSQDNHRTSDARLYEHCCSCKHVAGKLNDNIKYLLPI